MPNHANSSLAQAGYFCADRRPSTLGKGYPRSAASWEGVTTDWLAWQLAACPASKTRKQSFMRDNRHLGSLQMLPVFTLLASSYPAQSRNRGWRSRAGSPEFVLLEKRIFHSTKVIFRQYGGSLVIANVSVWLIFLWTHQSHLTMLKNHWPSRPEDFSALIQSYL